MFRRGFTHLRSVSESFGVFARSTTQLTPKYNTTMAFVFGVVGSAVYAAFASQPVATAIAAPILMWLIKKRYVKSIQNPVARTVVGVVDSTYIGAPIVLVVASVDLIVTSVTGR
jgi:hypothetical protein